MIDRDLIEWLLAQILLAVDTALVAELAGQLQCLVTELGRVYERKK